LGLALRYDVFGFGLGRDAWFTVLAFWFFAVGWVAAKATSTWQRAAVTVVPRLAVGITGGDAGRWAVAEGRARQTAVTLPSGRWLDETRYIIEDFDWLSAAEKKAIFEDNARKMFKLDTAAKA